MRSFEINRQTRRNVLMAIGDLEFNKLIKIPSGFNNNILWNLGHILVTQQALVYRLSGNPMNVDSQLVDLFKKGSIPLTYNEEILVKIKNQFIELIDQTEKDYISGLFKEFTEYPTSYGYTLRSVEEAIEFNTAHEALHLGYVMALKRAV